MRVQEFSAAEHLGSQLALRSACAKAVIAATALVPGAVLTSVVRISVMSASLPGVREPTLWERPALAAPLVELA